MATQTTGGGSTTSFSNTLQATGDVFTSACTGLTEDSTNIVILDVMANDLGGNAKTLFSIDNGINNTGAMSGYSAGDLLTQDTARRSNEQRHQSERCQNLDYVGRKSRLRRTHLKCRF